MNLANAFRAAAVAALLGFSANAFATYTITLVQDGADVIMSGSGSLDLTGSNVTAGGSSCIPSGSFGSGVLCTGVGATAFSAANALATPYSAPGSTSPTTNATSGSAFIVIGRDLAVPVPSGTSFTNLARFSGTNLAAFGLTLGTVRTYPLVSGDTLIIRAGAVPAAATPVPTSSQYALLALASLVAGVGIAATRRRRM